jgi:Ca2+-binding RTX toxin-like protein
MCQFCQLIGINLHQSSPQSSNSEIAPEVPALSNLSSTFFESTTDLTNSFFEATANSVASSGNAYINSVLYGTKWNSAVTYSFPTDATPYPPYTHSVNGIMQVSFEERQAIRQILEGSTPFVGAPKGLYGSFESVCNLGISETATFNDPTSDLMIAQCNNFDGANLATARVADFPELSNPRSAGDVWFGDDGNQYRNPILGTYAWFTHIHELGHALGLKHPHQAYGSFNTVMPTDRDSLEFTVMTYRSYIGGPTDFFRPETYGGPQTLMMYDILALQSLYGANYNTNIGATVYTWSPITGEMFVNGIGQGAPGGNRIFLTIWDGNGNDTYDMSNYSNGVSIDLRPGRWSVTSSSQLADLDRLAPGQHRAQGNVYNALQFNGDARSLIENATGGSGVDTIIGNDANNVLIGNAGNDTLNGGGGNDTLFGGDGNDMLFGEDRNDTLIYTSSSYTVGVSLSGGLDSFNGGAGTDTADFSSISVSDVAQHGLLITPFGSNFDAWMTTTGLPIRIATLVNIENIVGTPFKDTLLGTAGANLLKGGAGDDTIDGGAGVDRAAFSGQRSSYSFTPGGNTVSGPDGNDIVTNVELLAFSDVTVRSGQGESFPTPTSDFSGDFRSDILWQSSGGSPAVWLMNGDDSVLATPVGSFNPGPSWQVRSAGDFDADGRSDILWQGSDGTPAIWLMNGTNLVSTGAAGSFNPGPSWQVKDAADFNGDGRADILWQGSDGTPAIWLMSGTNAVSVGAAGPFNPGPSWQSVGTGDFDGNGRSDILWQGSDGTPAIWLMNGTNAVSIGAAGPFNPGPSWQIRGVGDFNGDGRSDILWQGSDGTPALMNGTNAVSVGAVGPFNPGPSWQVRGAEDFNGDGRSDILWQGSDGTPAIWLMDGTNVLSMAVAGSFNPGTDWHIIA